MSRKAEEVQLPESCNWADDNAADRRAGPAQRVRGSTGQALSSTSSAA